MKYLLILTIVLLSCSSVKNKFPLVVIKTDYGKIIVEVNTDKAPKTASAFLKNVDAGVYDGASFYRAVADATQSAYPKGVIQGGVYKTKPNIVETLPTIDHESPAQTGLSHKNGAISMARTDVGTARSEFFICIGDQSAYDNSKRLQPDGLGYAAFGQVVEGMDVVQKILSKNDGGEGFSTPIAIKEMVRD